jgi:chromosome segregation ATPase
MDKFKSIIGFILIYGFINLVLWGGQELYWRKDTQEINKIESYLTSEKNQITSLESKIDNQSGLIDDKQKELDRLKNDGLIDKYNLGVDNYNFLLQEYKSNVDVYKGKLTEYNSQIDRVNELIKKSGSRWYLIPIPIPGKSAKPKL